MICKKIIVSISIIYLISSIALKCYAKYVFEYNKIAAEIIINN